jgi:hypothetical protein
VVGEHGFGLALIIDPKERKCGPSGLRGIG